MRFTTILPAAAAGAALLCSAPAAHAQQTTNGLAAPQPGKGRIEVRQRLTFTDFGEAADGDDITDLTWHSDFKIGITGELALQGTVPITLARDTNPEVGPDDRDAGIGDFTLLARYRFLQLDTTGTDTVRAVAIAGAQIPSGQDNLSSKALDPIVGAVITAIRGRHGFNLGATWTFTTGDKDVALLPGDSLSDLLQYDGAYLFRLAPNEYDATTKASFYAQFELNGFYETNGDHELLFGPGLLYEATTWAAELSVQFPVGSDLDHRPERDFIITAGFRLLF